MLWLRPYSRRDGTGWPAGIAGVACCTPLALAFFGFSTFLTYSHAAWRGRIRASARIVLMSDPASIAEFDAELARVLRERFPADPLVVDHRVFAVVAWTAGCNWRFAVPQTTTP